MILELDALPDWITLTTDTFEKTNYLINIGKMFVGCCTNSRPWRFHDYVGRRRHDRKGQGGVAWAQRHGGEQGVLQAWGILAQQIGRAHV